MHMKIPKDQDTLIEQSHLKINFTQIKRLTYQHVFTVDTHTY